MGQGSWGGPDGVVENQVGRQAGDRARTAPTQREGSQEGSEGQCGPRMTSWAVWGAGQSGCAGLGLE